MTKEVQDHEYHKPPSMDGRGEATDNRRGLANRELNKRSMPSSWLGCRSVLQLDEEGPERIVGVASQWEAGAKKSKSRCSLKDRDRKTAGSGSRTELREPGAKKGALAIASHRRYSAKEKALILETVKKTQEKTGKPVAEILYSLGLPEATYYRWKARATNKRLKDVVVVPRRRSFPHIPDEVVSVRGFALDHPQMGYKRLTWQMVDEDVAYLRPYQVYRILVEQGLLRRRESPPPETLRHPPEPDHPDQVWHIDLMYLYIRPRWYYLVDILDGYSRFLVHWSLNLTMMADTVTLTIQEALERLPERRHGEPKLVHDHGGQFLSAEWRMFVKEAGLVDIKTRVAHPESNGRLERLHRTHREEGLTEDHLANYYRAMDGMSNWSLYYNYKRSHSALNYLCPEDYYRGDPKARLDERQQKLSQALESRKAYWEAYNECQRALVNSHLNKWSNSLTSM